MPEKFTVALLGGGAVGKSSITVRYLNDEFNVDYDPTILDSYDKVTKVDDIPVQLELLDTAGQDEFKSLREQSMRNAYGFVLVCDLTNPSTVANLEEFVKELNRVKEGELIPVVLVGNKLDLADKRAVAKTVLEDFAKEWLHSCPVFEVSAKDGIGIDPVFLQIVREMRSKKNPSLTVSDENGPTKKKSGSLFKKLNDLVKRKSSEKK
jgi:small GTP-binding protein